MQNKIFISFHKFSFQCFILFVKRKFATFVDDKPPRTMKNSIVVTRGVKT